MKGMASMEKMSAVFGVRIC